MAGTIEVTRPKGKGFRRDMFARYRILLDDVEVASLREGETVRLSVDPGAHRVEARVQWVWCGPIEVALRDGESTRFRVRPGGSLGEGLWQLLATRGEYLILERL